MSRDLAALQLTDEVPGELLGDRPAPWGQLLRAVLAHHASPRPRRAPDSSAAVLDRGEDLDLVRVAARRRRSARARARGWRDDLGGDAGDQVEPRDSRLATGDAAVAAVGEEQLRVRADRAQADRRGRSRRPPRSSWWRAIALRSRCRPRGPRAGSRRTPRGPPPRPRSSTARPRARSPRVSAPGRAGAAQRADPGRDHAPRADPASRRGASPRRRSPAIATGRQSAVSAAAATPGSVGHLAVGAVRLPTPARRSRSASAARQAAHLGAVDLMDEPQRDAELGLERARDSRSPPPAGHRSESRGSGWRTGPPRRRRRGS